MNFEFTAVNLLTIDRLSHFYRNFQYVKDQAYEKIFFSLFLLFAFFAGNAQNDSLQHYVGKYKFPDGSPVSEFTVAVENGTLMVSSAMGSTEFKKTSTVDVFEIVAYGGTATFKRTEGKVTSVQVLVGDVNIEGTRSEEKFAARLKDGFISVALR